MPGRRVSVYGGNAFVVSSERERRKELEGGGQAPHIPPLFSFFFFFSFLFRVGVQDQKEEEEKRGDLACRTTTRTSGRAPRRRKGREERGRRRRGRIEEKRRGDEACRTRKRPSDVRRSQSRRGEA